VITNFTWSETKRASNFKVHGLDFVDAELVFRGLTLLTLDSRFAYPEIRYVSLGLLYGLNVTVVHTENENEIRIISFRKSTKQESETYFDEIQN
jgi:uncharacterized DUF497 family protein